MTAPPLPATLSPNDLPVMFPASQRGTSEPKSEGVRTSGGPARPTLSIRVASPETRRV